MARIRDAPVPLLAPPTAHELARLVEAAGEMLAQLHELPAHTSEAWLAVMNVEKAVGMLHAVATAPEAWGGLPLLFGAQHLLGAASVYRLQAQRLMAQRSKGGRQQRILRSPRPASAAERVRRALADWPELDDKRIAEACGVDVGYVGKVRRRMKKPDKN